MMNARLFFSVALYSTAIAGHCFIYVVICCSFVLSFLLLFVAFDVLIDCILYFFGEHAGPLCRGSHLCRGFSTHSLVCLLTDLITFTQAS